MNKCKISVIAGVAIFIIAGVAAWFLMTENKEEADRVIPENRFDIFAEVTGRLIQSQRQIE